MMNGDRRARRIEAQTGQVALDRILNADTSLIHELHEHEADHRLRNRPDMELMINANRLVRHQIRHTKTRHMPHTAVIGQR